MQRKAMRRIVIKEKKKPSRIFPSQHSPILPYQLFLPQSYFPLYTLTNSLLTVKVISIVISTTLQECNFVNVV